MHMFVTQVYGIDYPWVTIFYYLEYEFIHSKKAILSLDDEYQVHHTICA